MLVSVLLFSQIYLFIVVHSFKAPDTPCPVTDDACITKVVADLVTAALEGDPKDGFVGIDPMHHDKIFANFPSLNLTLIDSTVKGLRTLKVLSSRVSEHNSLYVNFTLPVFEMSGKYELDGIFLSTPLQGHGNFNIKGSDFKINLEGMKHHHKKDDDFYLNIKCFIFQSDIAGTLSMDADKLFNVDKKLAESALKFLNSNSQAMISAWNPPITTANLNKVFTNINEVLSTVPLSKLVSGARIFTELGR